MGNRQSNFDLAVIGAGPAGAATAIAAARAGLRVALIDRGNDAGRIGQTLPPVATRLLDRLGVHGAFLATDPLPCHANRSTWGGDGTLEERNFIRDPNGHGWQIDRCRFDAMLIASARAAGACHLGRTVLTGQSRAVDGRWQFELTCLDGSDPLSQDWEKASSFSPSPLSICNGSGSPLSPSPLSICNGEGLGVRRAMGARLVIDASGRAAVFARGQGATRHHADHLVAVTALLNPHGEPDCDTSTLVEATPSGWWYSAPQAGGRLALAYFTDPDLLATQRAWTVAGWQAQLAATVHTRLRVEAHAGRPVGAPRVAAAGTNRLDQVAGDGWLAVGDAAAAFDPLSSHGLTAVLSSGLRAAAAAVAHLRGDPNALTAYAEQVEQSYARYLWPWQAQYAQEQRWPQAPFWQRRHAPVRSSL